MAEKARMSSTLHRERGLFFPRRVRQGEGMSHDGKVTTNAPDAMFGHGGTRVLPGKEGTCFRLGRQRLSTEACTWITALEHMSSRFCDQVRFWGVTPSHSFIEQLQNNGVVELRAVLAAFVHLYNEQ